MDVVERDSADFVSRNIITDDVLILKACPTLRCMFRIDVSRESSAFI